MTRGWGRSVRMTASSRAATATRSVATRSDFAYRLSERLVGGAAANQSHGSERADAQRAEDVVRRGVAVRLGRVGETSADVRVAAEVEGEVGTPSREPPGALARFPMPPERRRASAKTHSGSRTRDELAARSPIRVAGALSCDARQRRSPPWHTYFRLNAKQFGAIESEWTIRGGQLPEELISNSELTV